MLERLSGDDGLFLLNGTEFVHNTRVNLAGNLKTTELVPRTKKDSKGGEATGK
jgi:hypothetical protein